MAALMARRRRKADGIESERGKRTASVEDESESSSNLMSPTESPRKPASMSSLPNDALYSPSLLDDDKKNVSAELDKSGKSDKSGGKDESKTDSMPMAPSLVKPKVRKAADDKLPTSVSEEDMSELDNIVASVSATTSDENEAEKLDPPAIVSPKNEGESPPKSSKRSTSSSPGPMKAVKDYSASRSPSTSPHQLHKKTATPKTPPNQPQQLQRTKSSTKSSKSQRRKSNDNMLETSSDHRRMSRRRSNEKEVMDGHSHPRVSRRRSNDDGKGAKSPGRHKGQRRSSSKAYDEGDHSDDNIEVPRRASRRRSNDNGGGEVGSKSPGRNKHHHRSSRSEDRDRNDSPGNHKEHRARSNSEEDLNKNPGTHKSHRRKGPSRSVSRTQPVRTKSSSRPKLPATLESELSETVRSKTKPSGPRHKMPTTLEEELMSAANSPRAPRRKSFIPPSPLGSIEDDEDASLSGDDLLGSSKTRSKRDASGKGRHRKSRTKPKEEEEHEEYEVNLRDEPSDNSNNKPVGINDTSNKSEPSMNFMFEDSSNFESSFQIDLDAKTNHTTKSNKNSSAGSLSASSLHNDGFGTTFETDFGAFQNTTNESTNQTDAFGFSAADEVVADEVTPSFSKNLDFGADFGADFGGTWGSQQPAYDTTPIEKPPFNHVESMVTKIKWVTPRVNMVVASSPKQQNPPPVSNPLNGNVIVCRSGSCDVIEWSPQRQTQVMATSILTVDLKRKVVQKYGVTPETVDTVWTVTAGIHRSEGNNDGVRVAALMDLTLLGDRNREVLRLIAVWNWRYGESGGGPTLQSVLSPPSGSDFTYDTKTLKVADGCIFVAGASTKGPCVFLSKPSVRETWSANFIAKNTDLRISSMAVTNAARSPADPVPKSGDDENSFMKNFANDQRLPYLAVALNDGSVSVWTYDAAIKLNSKSKEAVRKLIFPVCRLHAVKYLKDCPVTNWSSKDRSESEKSLPDFAELGVCTHLEWIPYRASAHTQLLLLAASFQGALCLYHVALPKVQDKSSGKNGYTEIKAPTDKTVLNQTISLKPFCFSKWATTHHRASCSFVDLGPHVSPSLVLLMRGSHESPDYVRVALLTCPLSASLGGHKSKSAGDPLSFHVWDTHEWKNAKAAPKGLIHSSLTSTRGILYFTDTTVQELEFRTNTRFPMGTSGSGSIPCGLTTSGGMYWADSKSPSGLLTLYTTFNCERFKSSLSQDSSTPTLLEWTNPVRHHWLIETVPGDSKDSGSKIIKAGEDLSKGGVQSTVICELVTQSKIKKMYPYRLARNPYSPKGELNVAIWYRSLHSDSKTIGLVERDSDGIYGVVQFIEGRDMVFLPPLDDDSVPRALVVSANGGSVSLWKRNSATNSLAAPWKKDSSVKSCRPIIGVDPKASETYVELRQYVLTSVQNQFSIVGVASGSDNKFCLIAGPLVDEGDLEELSKTLPNMKENRVLWLDEREQITLVVPLPSEGSIRGAFGVATTQRILIVSHDLQILADVDSDIPPGSLVPMGSCTVAYFSPKDHKLRYLSGLSKKFGRSGVIANFPNLLPSYYTPWLMGIRPDRLLYSVYQNGTRLVERGQSGHSFMLPLATTRPALLLEPMLANAIATGGKEADSQVFLRTVLEKFGRKVATMSHAESEGIGNSGAGITPRVFEILDFYGLKSAASWLLTGTISFDRSANSRLLPSYLPVSVKAKAGFDADTHLHLISSGDQYFTEYVKSPDNNMSSTLPRSSDPTAALCHQFGRKAIRDGKVGDAMKMLDISGTHSTDAMILQMAMALQLDASKDSQAIINALHQKDSLTGKTPSVISSLAALASELKKTDSPSLNFHHQWTQSLAPSVQRSRKGGRHRSRLLGESSLSNLSMTPKIDSKLFSRELPESKLVWNEGPNGEKENLLMLDNLGEWFGRNRPIVFGKEGARRAEERGASTLAGILQSNEDDDSFGGENDDDFKDGWVNGVGEGLKGKHCGIQD